MKRMVAAGRLGRKSGRGFYEYSRQEAAAGAR
jgi:3-hydroxyacyl-CoA dehydrogenase